MKHIYIQNRFYLLCGNCEGYWEDLVGSKDECDYCNGYGAVYTEEGKELLEFLKETRRVPLEPIKPKIPNR